MSRERIYYFLRKLNHECTSPDNLYRNIVGACTFAGGIYGSASTPDEKGIGDRFVNTTLYASGGFIFGFIFPLALPLGAMCAIGSFAQKGIKYYYE